LTSNPIAAAENQDEERHLLPIIGVGSPSSDGLPARLGIRISEDCADNIENQLLLWMAANLSSRMRRVIGEIEFVIPKGVKVSSSSVVPFQDEADSMLSSAIAYCAGICARDCKIVESSNPSFDNQMDAVISIGAFDESQLPRTKREISASCDGWLAFVGGPKWMQSLGLKEPKKPGKCNPFGAYTAACIAAGDVFKFLVGMRPPGVSFAEEVCFSAYTLKSFDYGGIERAENPDLPEAIELGTIHLVGCGAVGHSFCHSLLPLNGLRGRIVLIDRKINETQKQELIDYWNLNRYILATVNDIGRPKAELLAGILSRLKKTITAVPYDDGFEDFVNNQNPGPLVHVLSCVDKNSSRRVIQDRLPRIIHGASTDQITTQLSLYDLSKETSCLKCYNEDFSSLESDDAIIERLKSLGKEEITQIAQERGVDPEKLIRFVSMPDCGLISGSELRRLSSQKGTQTEFSVSFVSAMSGIALAAEVCRGAMERSEPLKYSEALCPPLTDVYMNFRFNSSSIVSTKPRQNCWCNQGTPTPREVYLNIWRDNQ